MSKFEYMAFNGWTNLSVYANKLKETPKIKQIKKPKQVVGGIEMLMGPQSIALNIMGQHGWELISVPQIGKFLLVFKKKI